jgi:hypothetical protein
MTFDDFQLIHGILEVRYERAHRYWDDCGKLIEAVETRLPGLTCQKLDERGFQFTGTDAAGVNAASFGWDRCTADHGPDVASSKYADVAPEFTRLVFSGLSVKKIKRAGHRNKFILPKGSLEEAREWLARQEIWRFSGNQALGAPVAAGIVLRTRLEDRGLRVEIDAVSIQRQGRTIHAVMVDLDFWSGDPIDASRTDFTDFIKWNLRFSKQNLVSVFD